MTRLIEGKGKNQALKSSSVEVKFLTLALLFSLFFFRSCVYICVLLSLICLFSLGLLCVVILSMLGCKILCFCASIL